MLVAQSCPTLFDTTDCSPPPGCSVHAVLLGRILEWVAIPFSRGSSQLRDQTWAPCIAGEFFIIWATREAVVYMSHISLFKYWSHSEKKKIQLFKREGTYVYLWLIHVDVWQKPTQYCKATILQFGSVQFSRSVVSNSLWPHESQYTRPPCPSPTPGVHSNSCPSSQWCHPAISSSVITFSSCPHSLPESESFPMS